MFWDCHENLLKNKIRRQKRNKMVLKEQVVKKWSVSVERYYWGKNWLPSPCSRIIYAECSLLEFIIPSLSTSKINVCM